MKHIRSTLETNLKFKFFGTVAVAIEVNANLNWVVYYNYDGEPVGFERCTIKASRFSSAPVIRYSPLAKRDVAVVLEFIGQNMNIEKIIEDILIN